jgi:hypothetical protein
MRGPRRSYKKPEVRIDPNSKPDSLGNGQNGHRDGKTQTAISNKSKET